MWWSKPKVENKPARIMIILSQDDERLLRMEVERGPLEVVLVHPHGVGDVLTMHEGSSMNLNVSVVGREE